MQAWLENLAPGYGPALMWTIFALIGLLILLVLIRIVRGLTFGTFVAGGRNRKARLAVMDATAVDSHRRLVLVRRDDVEHLILIGGPTDVVVEQNIRLVPAARRPVPEEQAAAEHARPAAPAQTHQPPHPAPAAAPKPQPAAPRPAPAPPAPAVPPVTAGPVAPAVQPAARSEPRFAPPTFPAPPTPPRPAPAAPQAAGVQTLRPVTAAQPAKPDLDDALLEELEVTLEKEHRPVPAPQAAPSAADRSLDEEMSRLLSDLSGPKR